MYSNQGQSKVAELGMLSLIIPLFFFSLPFFFVANEDYNDPIKLNTVPPSHEMEYFATLLVEDLFMKGETKVIDFLFSKHFEGFFHSQIEETRFDRVEYKKAIEFAHCSIRAYRPRVIKIEYYNKKIQIIWACGVNNVGVPQSYQENCSSMGLLMFHIENGKIERCMYGNISSPGNEEYLFQDIEI